MMNYKKNPQQHRCGSAAPILYNCAVALGLTMLVTSIAAPALCFPGVHGLLILPPHDDGTHFGRRHSRSFRGRVWCHDFQTAAAAAAKPSVLFALSSTTFLLQTRYSCDHGSNIINRRVHQYHRPSNIVPTPTTAQPGPAARGVATSRWSLHNSKNDDDDNNNNNNNNRNDGDINRPPNNLNNHDTNSINNANQSDKEDDMDGLVSRSLINLVDQVIALFVRSSSASTTTNQEGGSPSSPLSMLLPPPGYLLVWFALAQWAPFPQLLMSVALYIGSFLLVQQILLGEDDDEDDDKKYFTERQEESPAPSSNIFSRFSPFQQPPVLSPPPPPLRINGEINGAVINGKDPTFRMQSTEKEANSVAQKKGEDPAARVDTIESSSSLEVVDLVCFLASLALGAILTVGARDEASFVSLLSTWTTTETSPPLSIPSLALGASSGSRTMIPSSNFGVSDGMAVSLLCTTLLAMAWGLLGTDLLGGNNKNSNANDSDSAGFSVNNLNRQDSSSSFPNGDNGISSSSSSSSSSSNQRLMQMWDDQFLQSTSKTSGMDSTNEDKSLPPSSQPPPPPPPPSATNDGGGTSDDGSSDKNKNHPPPDDDALV